MSSKIRLSAGIVALCVGIIGVSVLGQQPTTLRLASTPWPPFTNAAGQSRVALDLVHAALQRIGVTAETTIVPDGALTPALLEGRFDGSAALWRDAERERTLIYSKPYLENRLLLAAARGREVSATSLAALAGKRIALVDGFSYGEIPGGAAAPRIVPASSVEESLRKVLAGETDYALLDELFVEYLVNDHGEEVKARLALGSTPLLIRPLHFALRRDLPGAAAIIDRFNAELPKMIADHSYHRLLQVAWIEADVDGDGRPESVPATDQAGPAPPTRDYSILAQAQAAAVAEPPRRFFIGGRVYDGWGAVPDRYKVGDPTKTPWGSTVAPIFTFQWK
jgi:polar amino acid transport system substrate-binding protein